MTNDEIIGLLIERGEDGVSVQELAEADPRVDDRLLDFSDYDTEPLEPIYERARGVDDTVVRSAVMQLTAPLGRGAVMDLDVPLDNARAHMYRVSDELLASRARLVGWSGLPPTSRRLPTWEDLQLDDPVELAGKMLVAAGPAGILDSNVSYWTQRHREMDDPANLYLTKHWRAAVKALEGDGWMIREYAGRPGSVSQLAHSPEYPMRERSDVPPVPASQSYDWPSVRYRYEDGLWQAIITVERSGGRGFRSWLGGTYRQNPVRSYQTPAWFGEPLPDGEVKRKELIRWAEAGGYQEILRLASPGSIEMILESSE